MASAGRIEVRNGHYNLFGRVDPTRFRFPYGSKGCPEMVVITPATFRTGAP